ncbi:MAG: hypothetical protein AAFX79_02830 [Planctomycetota bacterium]
MRQSFRMAGRTLGRSRLSFVVGCTGLVVVLANLGGCDNSYPHDSPEALLDSTRQMVLDGEIRRVHELTWSEGDGEALVVERLARTLGVLQRLGGAVADAFPDEVEGIRRQADEAAADGRIDSLIGRALTAQPGAARGVPRAVEDRAAMRRGLDGVVRELLGDPYGWIERNAEALQPVRVTDDIVALSWRDKPVLGLRIVERDGLWYYDIPFDLPLLRGFGPKSDEDFEILAELVASIHNTLLDLAKEVERGEHENLESVAQQAGEYALPTVVIVMVAYGKALENRDDG